MIGYTPAEMDLRAAHGDPYATGKDQDDTRDDAHDTEAVA